MIRTTNVRYGKIDLTSARYVDETTYARWTRRQVPERGDVLLTREAPMGEVGMIDFEDKVFLGQRIVSYRVNKSRMNAEFLLHVLQTKTLQDAIRQKASGSTVQHMRVPDTKTLLVPIPSIAVQLEIVAAYRQLKLELERLREINCAKARVLMELKQTLLARAFSGELTATGAPTANNYDFATPEQAANILAFMYWRHERARRGHFFGHVMGQKTLDLVERVGRVELGRAPYKDAAGPNDHAHMIAAERWAKQQGFFEFVERHGGGYDFKKLSNHSVMLAAAKTALKPVEVQMARVTEILVGKDKVEAEVFATVLAAWNNLIIDGADANEAAIIYEGRENWHLDKSKIPISKFHSAIQEIRRRNLVPDGTAKVVRHRQASLL